MTNHRGILMSAQMVLAYGKGWKCKTRRTRGLDKVNVRPDDWVLESLEKSGAVFVAKHDPSTRVTVKPPYGVVGDFLYFKETWKMFERDEDGRDFLHFRADDAKIDPLWWTEEDWTGPSPKWNKAGVFEKWQSSMFMPGMCARYRNIPILSVHAERLHLLTWQEALKEGVGRLENKDATVQYPYYARYDFMNLWDALNEKRGHGWKHNDWVWIYEFPYSFEMEFLYGAGEGNPVGILNAGDIIKGDL